MKKGVMAKTSLDWKMEKQSLRNASDQAEEFLEVCDLAKPPVDPFQIAASERRLTLIPGDFRKRFDGQLEYHCDQRRFLLFLNTKYDRDASEGRHHPRTRFSLAHELGHIYLEHHVAYLMGGGKAHRSKGEFDHADQIEREADAFAAGLLMPSGPFRAILNQEEPTLDIIEELASTFETSIVSTLFRSVQLSDFPCAAVGIKDGKLAWCFVSEPLIDAKCYPPARGLLPSPGATQAWKSFQAGDFGRYAADSQVSQWFRTFNADHLDEVYVSEEYLPISSMNTVVGLLTVSEDELVNSDDEDD